MQDHRQYIQMGFIAQTRNFCATSGSVSAILLEMAERTILYYLPPSLERTHCFYAALILYLLPISIKYKCTDT